MKGASALNSNFNLSKSPYKFIKLLFCVCIPLTWKQDLGRVLWQHGRQLLYKNVKKMVVITSSWYFIKLGSLIEIFLCLIIRCATVLETLHQSLNISEKLINFVDICSFEFNILSSCLLLFFFAFASSTAHF